MVAASDKEDHRRADTFSCHYGASITMSNTYYPTLWLRNPNRDGAWHWDGDEES